MPKIKIQTKPYKVFLYANIHFKTYEFIFKLSFFSFIGQMDLLLSPLYTGDPLNLLNELRKSDKMRGLPSFSSLFRNEFNEFNNTGV